MYIDMTYRDYRDFNHASCRPEDYIFIHIHPDHIAGLVVTTMQESNEVDNFSKYELKITAK